MYPAAEMIKWEKARKTSRMISFTIAWPLYRCIHVCMFVHVNAFKLSICVCISWNVCMFAVNFSFAVYVNDVNRSTAHVVFKIKLLKKLSSSFNTDAVQTNSMKSYYMYFFYNVVHSLGIRVKNSNLTYFIWYHNSISNFIL